MDKPHIRLLLVEDDADDQLLIREMLAEAVDTRFTVTCANSLARAVESLDQSEADVILLDLNLPDSRGLESLRRMMERAGECPVVVLTGLDDARVGLGAVREGAQDYLLKGQVTLPLLTRAIAYAIERKRVASELSESRHFVRQVADASPDILYVYDLHDHRFVYCNARLVQVLGYTLADLQALGAAVIDCLIHPEDREAVRENLRRAAEWADAAVTQLAYRVQCADGEWRWLQSRETVFARERDGRVRQILGAALDITDQRAMKAAEERRMAALAGLVEVTARLSAVSGVDDLCRQAVEFGRERLGFERLGIWLTEGGTRVRGTFGTDESNRTRDERTWRLEVGEHSPMGRILLGQSSYELSHGPVGPGAVMAWLLLVPLIGRQERVLGILSADSLSTGLSFDDHSVQALRLYGVAIGHLLEAVRSEQARRESQAIFRNVAEATAAILFITRGTRFVYVNPAFEALTGFSTEALLAMNFWDVVQPEDRELVRARGLARQRGEPAPAQYEFRLRTRDGATRWIDFRAETIEFEGEPAVLGTALDITHRKHAEEMLRQYAQRMETLRLVQQELQTARRIQQGLLPKRAPDLPGLEVAGVTHSAEVTGGDYFDYLLLPDGSLGLVVGDAMGHGLGPALIAADTCAYVRALARSSADLSHLLVQANRLLLEDMGAEGFVALTLVRLDAAAHTLHYANAGQASGYLIGADGRLKASLDSTDTPLGVNAEGEFPAVGPIPIEPGDLVCLASDGVQEALSPREEPFGIERLLDTLRANRHATAREIVEAVWSAVRVFSSGQPLLDDVTVVVAKCRKEAGAP